MDMYEPIELKIERPEDAAPLSMSPTKVRIFMERVNGALLAEHRLPGRSPEVVNAILANAIETAQQAGDRTAEYDAWAIIDDLTYRTITDTNVAREAVGLDTVSHYYRQQQIWTAERYARGVQDYEAAKAKENANLDERVVQQNRQIQDDLLELLDNKAFTKDRCFGIMLLLESAKPQKTANIATIEELIKAAARDIYVRIYNQQVRTPEVSALEMIVQYGEQDHDYARPRDVVDTYKEMYPDSKFETSQGAYIRFRDALMAGITQLYRPPRS